jgi:hypothetical protein
MQSTTVSLATALYDGGQRHPPAPLYPRERLGTHCTLGWVGPRAGLDCAGDPARTGFHPRTVRDLAGIRKLGGDA